MENQKESLSSRRKLAEETQKFKKQPADIQWKTLLKSYQQEIDQITKRGKFAETCFLNLYKVLSEAPDPSPLIKTALEATKRVDGASLALENKRLRAELEEATQNSINNKQLTVERDKLKREVDQLQETMTNTVSTRLADREAEFKKELDDRVRIWKEREHGLTRQLSQLQNDVHSAKKRENFVVDSSYDKQIAGKLAEMEIVTMDLERSQLRIAALERDNSQLKSQLFQANSESSNAVETERTQSRAKMETLEQEIVQLQTDLDRTKAHLIQQQVLSTSTITDLEHKGMTLQDQVKLLEDRLAMVADYDEVKREWQTLKTVELAGVEESGSLEHLLAIKSRKLQDALTHAQNHAVNLQAELDQVSADLQEQKESYNKQLELTQRLESQLEGVLSSGPASHPLSHMSSMDLGSPTTPGASSTIIPILTSQRDRYRSRNAELENQLKTLQQTMAQLDRETATLRDDNLKLYEKLRYTQSKEVDVEKGRSSRRVEETYGRIYEERLDPFREFAKRVRLFGC